MKKILNIIALGLFLAFLPSCSDDSSVPQGDEAMKIDWRYFDRRVYLPKGASVLPEAAAAQESVVAALNLLSKNTMLGSDFFLIAREEASLLTPTANYASGHGRPWLSFIQLWDDDTLNQFISKGIGVSEDQDVIVARNSQNEKEYFIIIRLSCFYSGNGCYQMKSGDAKGLILRAFGYLLGMNYGDGSSSAVLKLPYDPYIMDEGELKKFYADFDNKLELIKNSL